MKPINNKNNDLKGYSAYIKEINGGFYYDYHKGKTEDTIDNKKPILINERLRPLHFLPWRLFKKRQNCSYRLNGIITYGIYKSPDDYKIIAYCGWTPFDNKYREEFLFSSYGYEKAIKWIEERRISLIEDLL